MPQFQQGHALLIGVADYEDAQLRLAGPITLSDATGVANALKDASVAAYPESQVHLLPGAGKREREPRQSGRWSNLQQRSQPQIRS